MNNGQRFPFVAAETAWGDAALRPVLPLTLALRDTTLTGMGVLDTGVMVNVLPYQMGLDLGATWEAQTTPVRLTGNLAHYEARALLLEATIASFAPVSLIFAWSQSREVPLLLGQVNFFMEFDVCFYRSQRFFEVHTK